MLHIVPNITLAEIFTLTPLTLEHGWLLPGAPRVRMWIALSRGCLLFAGEVAGIADFDTNVPSASFHEGLWTRNCLECFLGEEGSARYQEFNLGPNAAWWTCTFAGPRKRDAQQRRPQRILTSAECLSNAWRAGLSVPLAELPIEVNEQAMRLNLTAIVGPADKQSFVSYADLKSAKPDFHRPEDFVIAAAQA